MQRPPPAAISASDLACPRCDKGLLGIDEPGLRVHACETCGGAFADRVAAATRIAPRADATRKLPCPVCKAAMRRVRFSPRAALLVDLCADHGTWFDVEDIGIATVIVLAGGAEWAQGSRPNSRAEVQRRGEALRAAMQGRAVPVLDGVPEVPDLGRAQWLTAAVISAMFHFTED